MLENHGTSSVCTLPLLVRIYHYIKEPEKSKAYRFPAGDYTIIGFDSITRIFPSIICGSRGWNSRPKREFNLNV